MNKRKLVTTVVFLDLILNALLCFIALFVLALIQINPEATEEPKIDTPGKYIAILEWPAESGNDVDLYMMNPKGRVAYFSSRQTGSMYLEHDDLGRMSKRQKLVDTDNSPDANQERIILHGIVPGEYIVNAHMYNRRTFGPTPVSVILYRLEGADAQLIKEEFELKETGDEHTAFRFTLDTGGHVTNISHLQRSVMGKVKKQEATEGSSE